MVLLKLVSIMEYLAHKGLVHHKNGNMERFLINMVALRNIMITLIVDMIYLWMVTSIGMRGFDY